MAANPWRDIRLDVYESHMSDESVGQMDRLREITGDQFRDHHPRAVGILGIAGGNGLDVIDPASVDAIRGYDINPEYLEACRLRYAEPFGGLLDLIECSIDRSLRIDRADLVIANLIVEYVGISEFVAFSAANAGSIGVLSCVTQQNRGAGIVSSTRYSSAFAGLESIASEIDPDVLESELRDAGFKPLHTSEYSLPNGKVLTRQDFDSLVDDRRRAPSDHSRHEEARQRSRPPHPHLNDGIAIRQGQRWTRD